MYFYIISCQANILSTVSKTKHINVYPVNLIIFTGDFEETCDYPQDINFCIALF